MPLLLCVLVDLVVSCEVFKLHIWIFSLQKHRHVSITWLFYALSRCHFWQYGVCVTKLDAANSGNMKLEFELCSVQSLTIFPSHDQDRGNEREKEKRKTRGKSTLTKKLHRKEHTKEQAGRVSERHWGCSPRATYMHVFSCVCSIGATSSEVAGRGKKRCTEKDCSCTCTGQILIVDLPGGE